MLHTDITTDVSQVTRNFDYALTGVSALLAECRENLWTKPANWIDGAVDMGIINQLCPADCTKQGTCANGKNVGNVYCV